MGSFLSQQIWPIRLTLVNPEIDLNRYRPFVARVTLGCIWGVNNLYAVYQA